MIGAAFENTANFWLPVIWFGVIGFGVFLYVLLDGFVLGLGILLPKQKDEKTRDLMINTAAPVWDGNETWLVLGGAGLLAAFPKAYAVLLSSLYIPILLMVLALVLRGVAFEFRFKTSGAGRVLWGRAFATGSTVATFCQGIILGTLVQGLPADTSFISPFIWLTPFSILTAIALLCGYALLGACWLIIKTDGNLQKDARAYLSPLVLSVMVFILAVSIWLVVFDYQIFSRWFKGYEFLWLAPVPALTIFAGYLLYRQTKHLSNEKAPFLLAQIIFLLCFIGLAAGMWPFIIPPELTIWNAASPPESQGFLLWGLIFLLPLILGYTAWSYHVFRGKVSADSSYH